jgi:hypothetical protein
MTYASTVWKFVADTCLFKLQILQNKVLRTPVHDLYTALNLVYVYDYIK